LILINTETRLICPYFSSKMITEIFYPYQTLLYIKKKS